ncbi:cupin domain-containing protein [Plebeiibacterium sediminum]|uniref:Cupin domain-containing protein n=1 Tax=Plebeiibacterium sediminum TaxID=2992112 RepID=A0AAE3M797_9BACT|nr:cupin domain-containing protein [Plebeiobacterium sediminum]MCW3788591.1 cupin domain-containing protein [Plebeiobacterium sediminum]
MKVYNKENVSHFKGENIESFLLISKLNSNADNLTVAISEVEPKGYQYVHLHESEQVCYILEGTGVMSVDGEDSVVKPGDCVFVPSNAKHGIKNSGVKILKYLSVMSPSYEIDEFQES